MKMKIVNQISLLALILINAQHMTVAGSTSPGLLDSHGCIKRLKPSFTRWQEPSAGEVKYTNNSVIVCTGVTCAEIKYDALQRIFPDFLASLEMPNLAYRGITDVIPFVCSLEGASKAGIAKFSYCLNSDSDDMDYCCPTKICAACIFDYNLNDEYCFALSKVTRGVCGHGGQCHDSCFQQYTIQRLLAWNTYRTCVGVFSFEVPAYCSCKKQRDGH